MVGPPRPPGSRRRSQTCRLVELALELLRGDGKRPLLGAPRVAQGHVAVAVDADHVVAVVLVPVVGEVVGDVVLVDGADHDRPPVVHGVAYVARVDIDLVGVVAGHQHHVVDAPAALDAAVAALVVGPVLGRQRERLLVVRRPQHRGVVAAERHVAVVVQRQLVGDDHVVGVAVAVVHRDGDGAVGVDRHVVGGPGGVGALLERCHLRHHPAVAEPALVDVAVRRGRVALGVEGEDVEVGRVAPVQVERRRRRRRCRGSGSTEGHDDFKRSSWVLDAPARNSAWKSIKPQWSRPLWSNGLIESPVSVVRSSSCSSSSSDSPSSTNSAPSVPSRAARTACAPGRRGCRSSRSRPARAGGRRSPARRPPSPGRHRPAGRRSAASARASPGCRCRRSRDRGTGSARPSAGHRPGTARAPPPRSDRCRAGWRRRLRHRRGRPPAGRSAGAARPAAWRPLPPPRRRGPGPRARPRRPSRSSRPQGRRSRSDRAVAYSR